MKRKILAFLLILSANVAFAGPEAIFYAHTGTAIPVSSTFFKAAYSQGFNAGLMAGLRFSPRFEVQGAISINNCAFDNSGFYSTLPEVKTYKQKFENEEPIVNIDGGQAYAWNLYANMKLIFPPKEGGKVESYFYVGGGLFSYKQGEITVMDEETEARMVFPGHEKIVPSKSETVLGTGFGLGINLLLEEHMNFFMEAGLSVGFTKSDPTMIVPLRFGVSIRP
jgi:hypothetical protein